VSAQLLGWTRTTLGYGDVVTLYVWQAKTKLPVGRFNKVEFSDGTVMRDTQTGADDGGGQTPTYASKQARGVQQAAGS